MQSLAVTPVAPGRRSAVEVEVGPTAGLVAGRIVEWQFMVTNRRTHPANLLFLSAMFGDVKLHAAGRQAALDMFFQDGPVYRWSAGRVFAQPIIPAVLPANSAWRCSLAPSTLQVGPGRHLLDAHVNAVLDRRLYSLRFRRYVDVAPPP